MAISTAEDPTYYDHGEERWVYSKVLAPTIDTFNPKAAANLTTVINHEYDQNPDIIIDFSKVKLMTNLAARILCKTLYGKQGIIIENSNKAIQSSLEWAADYLYKKGELDEVPWQVSGFSL